MAEGGRTSPPKDESRIVVSVDEEKREAVTIALKIRGLKARSTFTKFFAKLTKPIDPGPMMANAEVKKWEITEKGLSLRISVRAERKKKKSEEGPDSGDEAADKVEDGKALPFEIFQLTIEQFPSEIYPDYIKYDVRNSDSGKGFIFISLQKREAGISWKQYQRDNGTLDAANSTS